MKAQAAFQVELSQQATVISCNDAQLSINSPEYLRIEENMESQTIVKVLNLIHILLRAKRATAHKC